MKSLIIYGSNHGFTEKCTEILGSKIQGDYTLLNIKAKKDVCINDYNTIIIGGSVHAGKIQKQLKEFMIENEQVLKNKRIGFFLCCADYDNVNHYYESEFPRSLLEHAFAKVHFGHAYYLDKLNFMLKAVIKKVAKVDKSEENIRYDQMDILIKEANLL